MIRNKINTVEYSVTDLVFAEYNPRELTQDQHQDLKDSITRFGFVDPLIVNTHKERKNILVGGHQRLRIAKELGYKYVPCVEVDLTPDKEKELNVRLNKNTGQWDWDALANHFDVGELLEWGFSEDELQFTEPEVQGLTEDDDVPEVEEAITQAGDMWLLGEHRVLCGDATIKEDVERLMDGQKADMVFTDPPYGIAFKGQMLSQTSKNGKRVDNYKGANTKHDDIKNDELNDENLFSFCFSFLNLFKTVNPSSWYICFSQLDLDILLQAMRKNNIEWKNIIAWVKNQATLSGLDYKLRYEPIVYGQSGSSFYGERYKNEDVWEITRTLKNDLHPTMKPIELITKAINNSSKLNNKVFDPFLGSGSTLIACEKTNRKCYGMEIDPHYCDVIVKRWEDYTGKQADRIRGKLKNA